MFFIIYIKKKYIFIIYYKYMNYNIIYVFSKKYGLINNPEYFLFIFLFSKLNKNYI